MSKSLEALEELKNHLIKPINARSDFTEWVIEIYNTIKQDLNCLEELKQVWNKEEWCKGIPLSVDSLKSLFNYNKELFEENLKLDKENLILKQSVKDTYDTSQEIIADLKEKNQKLEKALDKACKKLDWDCPVSQDLIADLDCENRCSADFEECCRECWKIYFLKEELGDEH